MEKAVRGPSVATSAWRLSSTWYTARIHRNRPPARSASGSRTSPDRSGKSSAWSSDRRGWILAPGVRRHTGVVTPDETLTTRPPLPAMRRADRRSDHSTQAPGVVPRRTPRAARARRPKPGEPRRVNSGSPCAARVRIGRARGLEETTWPTMPQSKITPNTPPNRGTDPPGADADLPERLRVHSLARVLGTTSRKVLDALSELDGRTRSAHSSVDRTDAVRVRDVLAQSADSQPSGAADEAAVADAEPESRLLLETPNRTRRSPARPPTICPCSSHPCRCPPPAARWPTRGPVTIPEPGDDTDSADDDQDDQDDQSEKPGQPAAPSRPSWPGPRQGRGRNRRWRRRRRWRRPGRRDGRRGRLRR